MVRSRQLPDRDFLIFLGTYLSAKTLFQFALARLIAFVGASPLAVDAIVAENEVPLQLFSMLIALLAVFKVRRESHLRESLLRLPHLPPDTLVNLIASKALKGFLWASLGVAASVFIGYVELEWPRWDFRGLWALAPALVFQSLGLLAWVLVFDRSYRFLLDSLLNRHRSRGVELRLLVAAMGASQLFFILNGSPHALDQMFTGLLAALISGSYLLWIEAGPRIYGQVDRAMIARTAGVAGFLLPLVHLYGLELGGNRGASLMNLFQGPLPEPTGSLANAGLAGNTVLLLLGIFLVNVLLQRVLRASSR